MRKTYRLGNAAKKSTGYGGTTVHVYISPQDFNLSGDLEYREIRTPGDQCSGYRFKTKRDFSVAVERLRKGGFIL